MANYTEKQKDFIGSKFSTPKGGVLKVIDVFGKDKHGVTLFSVECSLCSEDKEVFPEPFISSKSGLLSGKSPCGCVRNARLSKSQDLIMTNRLLKDKLPHLHAVDIIEEKGKPRKFVLECDICSKDKELWPLGSITSVKSTLTNSGQSCGCAMNVKYTKFQYEILIKRECESRGYKFLGFIGKWKGHDTNIELYNPTNNNHWKPSINSFINKGAGCSAESGKKKYTRREQEQRLERILKVEGGEFIEWVKGYKDNRSKFTWYCHQGHLAKTSARNFIFNGNRCRYCNKERKSTGNGYFPYRKYEKDYLYVLYFKTGGYLKIGRSFNIKRRIKQLSKASEHNINDIEVLSVYTNTHKIVCNTEQHLHKVLTKQGYYHKESKWSVETFNLECRAFLFKALDGLDIERCLDYED